jgi:hypothetical protein
VNHEQPTLIQLDNCDLERNTLGVVAEENLPWPASGRTHLRESSNSVLDDMN